MSIFNKLQFLALVAAPAFTTAENTATFKDQPASGLLITCPADQTIGTSGGQNCTATVALPAAQVVVNACPGLAAISFSSEMGSGSGPFFNVPTGKYPVQAKAVNSCGEEATCLFTITVKDVKKPSPVLVKELFANLDATGAAKFTARLFDLGSTDNCSPKHALRFSFSQNMADSVRLFDCDSLGARAVNIFVTDEAGNFSSKKCSVNIVDASGACELLFVGGKIENEAGQPVVGVSVSLSAGADFSTEETGATGSFLFEKIHSGEAVSIEPKKDVNPLNGVSTIDLALISRHVLGQKPLASPLKIIAADINRNGQVTTGDIVQLRKLILGEYADFPQNDSWRFVPKSHAFANPAQPFSAQVPGELGFDELSTSQPGLDFWGIKIGDVSGDALPSNLAGGTTEERGAAPVILKTKDLFYKKGETVEAVFESENGSLDGLQATLLFDHNSLAFNGLGGNEASGFSDENTSLARLAEGKLPISWFAAEGKTAPADGRLFSVKFTATADGQLARSLSLGNNPTTPSAFDREGRTYELELTIEGTEARAEWPAPSLALQQNEPNPASGPTRVRFSLPAAGRASLTLFDATGRPVHRTGGDFGAGESSFELDPAALGLPGGLYLYRLDAPTGSLCRKLDLIFR